MKTGPHGSRAGHVRKEARALCCLKDFFPFISAAQEGSCSLCFSSQRSWLLIPCLLLFLIFLLFLLISLFPFQADPPSKTFSLFMSYFFFLSHRVWKTLSQSLFVYFTLLTHASLCWVRFSAQVVSNVCERRNKQAPAVTHTNREMNTSTHLRTHNTQYNNIFTIITSVYSL